MSNTLGLDDCCFGASETSLDTPAVFESDAEADVPPPTPLPPFNTSFPLTTFSRDPLMLPDIGSKSQLDNL